MKFVEGDRFTERARTGGGDGKRRQGWIDRPVGATTARIGAGSDDPVDSLAAATR